MGILDAPVPIFAWLDTQAAVAIPPLERLLLWGIIAALVSMGLYRLVSNQWRISQTKANLNETRRQLDAYDGELADAWPLIRRVLQLSLLQVGLVAWPALLSSLPLLALIGWLSTAYGYTYPPPGIVPAIRTMPAPLQTEWVGVAGNESVPPGRPPHILVADSSNGIVADVFLPAPVPVIHKWQWWNALLGNPGGYLPEHTMVDRIEVALPGKKYLGFGPQWLRGWEAPFFGTLITVSIGIKILFRIE